MPRLVAHVRSALYAGRYSPRTTEAYVSWVVRYVRFCGLRHPRHCGELEVCRFLQHLTDERRAAPSTRNQAQAALLFLYQTVLERPIPGVAKLPRAKRGTRVPGVLAPEQVRSVLNRLRADVRDVVSLLYGAGLRLREALALRVRDVDLRRRVVTVRTANGDVDRRTILPDSLVEPMRRRIDESRRRHLSDALSGAGHVALPEGLSATLPASQRDWRWTWVFPAVRTRKDRRTGDRVRHHLHPATVQRAIAAASVARGLGAHVTARTFRHSFAAHLLRSGHGVPAVQALLGHRDAATTMVYLRVVARRGGIRSPLDTLAPHDDPPPLSQRPLRTPL